MTSKIKSYEFHELLSSETAILKRQCLDAANVLRLQGSTSTRVQDQISIPCDLSVFSYSQLKLSEWLWTTSRVDKKE